MSAQQVVMAFLSSTSRDLAAHRAQVREHCGRFGYRFRMMEEFGAQDGAADVVSLGEIEGCRLFVGVYARRYGYVPTGTQLSVTELEYREAERTGLPRLLFVIAPDYTGDALEAHRDDGDPAQAGRLQRFLDQLATQRVWDTFTTPAHLAHRVAFAISKWEGWRQARPSATRYRYVGRQPLLQRLRADLVEGRRMALLGIGGIGKTLTAAEVALQAMAEFPGGVLWVGLGTQARDAEQQLQATMRSWAACHHPGRLADAAHLTPETVRQWIADAPGRVLVVLDDIWHARVGRELLRLVPEGTGLLATTRRSDVARQMDLEPVSIDRMSQEEAVILLRDRVGDLPSLAALSRIAALLEGHPLALEIVAAHIVAGPPDLAEELPDAIAGRLRDNPGPGVIGIEAELSAPLEAADAEPSRYSSLSVALSLTYNTFPEDLKRRFRVTGVLAPDAPLSEPLLAAVWGDDLAQSMAGQEFASRTAALVSSGVLSREATAFTRHPMIRLYALDVARQAGDEPVATQRYVEYVLDRVLPRLAATSPEQWDVELGDELPHVHFVGDLLTQTEAGEGDGRHLIRFAVGVERYLEHRREVPGGPWLQAAAAASAAKADWVGQARFLNALASFHYARRDSRSALMASHEAWKLSQTHGDRAGQAKAALLLGYHYIQSDPLEAPPYFELACDLSAQTGDAAGRIEALIQLAHCDADSRHAPQTRRRAGERLLQALDVARESGARLGETRALIRLGNLRLTCAEPEAARGCFQDALTAARSLGSQGEEAAALLGMGCAQSELDDLASAAQALEMAAQLFRQVGDRVGQATALRNAAQLAELRLDPCGAARLYAAALPLVRKRTLLELDAFALPDMRATPMLTVRLDDAQFNDHREQYRARLFEDQGLLADGAAKQGPQTAPMPDDALGLLVRQTIAVASTQPPSTGDWHAALAELAGKLGIAGAYWAVDADFVHALAEMACGRETLLPPEHTYHHHLQMVQDRITRRRRGEPAYDAQALQYFLGNTFAVRTGDKDKARDWAEQLRHLQHDATTWGDRSEAELLGALLGLATDRLASVDTGNPYAQAYNELLQHLSGREELLLDFIERESIAAMRAGPHPLGEWRSQVAESLELTVLWRQHREEAFYRGLLSVLERQPAALAQGHAYERSLAYVANAVASGAAPLGIPAGQLRLMASLVQDGGPAAPEQRDAVRAELSRLAARADSSSDADELALFRGLAAMLDGRPSGLDPTRGYGLYLTCRLGLQV